MPALFTIDVKLGKRNATLHFNNRPAAIEAAQRLRDKGHTIIGQQLEGYAVYATAEDAVRAAELIYG